MTDFPGFDERADAETLRKAMKGLGKFSLLFVLKKNVTLVFLNKMPCFTVRLILEYFELNVHRRSR